MDFYKPCDFWITDYNEISERIVYFNFLGGLKLIFRKTKHNGICESLPMSLFFSWGLEEYLEGEKVKSKPHLMCLFPKREPVYQYKLRLHGVGWCSCDRWACLHLPYSILGYRWAGGLVGKGTSIRSSIRSTTSLCEEMFMMGLLRPAYLPVLFSFCACGKLSSLQWSEHILRFS